MEVWPWVCLGSFWRYSKGRVWAECSRMSKIFSITKAKVVIQVEELVDDILKVYERIVIWVNEFLKKISPVLSTALFLSLSLNFTHTHIHTSYLRKDMFQTSKLLRNDTSIFSTVDNLTVFFFFLFLLNKIIWSLLNSLKGLKGRLCPAEQLQFSTIFTYLHA